MEEGYQQKMKAEERGGERNIERGGGGNILDLKNAKA